MPPISNPLAELRRQFLDQLPVRLKAIHAQYQGLAVSAWKPDGAEALRRLLHGLASSASTFGLQSVSNAAHQAETRLAALLGAGRAPAEAEWQAIGADLDRLDRLTQIRLESGAPSVALPRHDRSPLVYLVESDPVQAEHLSQALQDDGYRVRVFATTSEFRIVCDTCAATDAGVERPAAVVMNLVSPEGPVAGAELLTELKATHIRCPPVVFVSERDDMQARLAAFRAGACRYLLKPVAPERLINLLDALTGRQPTQPYRVLMVDDDPLALEPYAAVLRAAGMDVQTLSQPLRILEVLNGFEPDVAVLDVYMPEASGPELAAVLRERDAYLQLPILFLSAEADISQQLLALNLGGDDFLVKPVQPDHLVSAVAARARRARQNAAIRQRLQTTLYEREREHQALDHHAIVSMADTAGNITYVNDKFCEISGYSRDELLGRNHRIVKSGEHPPGFYQDMWQTIAGGKVWEGEICNRRKDGSHYWVESTITPFLDDEGLPYQYVSIRTDITHVMTAEAALRRQSEMQGLIAETGAVLLAASTANMDAAIARVLRRSGEHIGADRASLFLFSEDGARMSNTHEWCAPGIPRSDTVQNVPLERAPWWKQQISLRGMVVIPDVAALPAEASAEKARFEEQQIRSLLAFPLQKNENIYGFVGFDAVRSRRDWVAEEIDLLKIVADVISSALARRHADQAVELHKERLRRGQMFANIGTWDWHIQSGELFWTERIAPLFGYPVGELETAYDNFLAAIHPDDRQAVIDAVAACVERDVPYEIEHRVVWPDGTVRWLLERGAVARDADGKPLQMLGVVQDIDDRKRAELALLERERQLREAQTLAHIGNWTADLRSGELVWSDEIYRIFGHAPGSFEPRVEAFHAAVHPDDRDKVRESENRAEQTGRHDVVHRIVRPDGTVRHVHELAQMETDAAGNRLRLAGTVQDVTERVEVEQALMALSEEADRANRAKSDFLSSMSHELRTPMNAILGFGQLMEYDAALPEEHQDNVQEILRAGRHLLELINEVLDLAKVESGHIDLSLEPVEVCPIVEECLGLVGPLADQRDIQLSHKGLKGAAVRADRTRLKQALLNLLSNAIKYNRDKGSVHIEIQLEDTDRLRIRVTDSGPGIPAARLAELFQPFNRLVAEYSDIEGTGIGLTITRRIVELMGGSVDVESELGVGSTFWIELPLESAPASVRTHTGAPVDGTVPLPYIEAAQHTVLYIEDNPANIKLVAQILGRRPHIHLLTAHTPELGIELALARRPELILLDINLPGMDGYQVLEIFKADARLKAIPVVAITANAMSRDIERGKAAGFVDYLTKPLNVGHFHRAVDACLGNPTAQSGIPSGRGSVPT
ncbi:MAG: PAS domain-containing protein [Gammaproteobacteria bacterium]|nr:PAS domain-containing protein [Gammaproteobacteria bacterium]MBU1408125.1 PAS domain-containing protein [Gammaproteobacteria bacterium]MBU1532822.1 PAS domain-containing protein [Gammaproteobacteria bacterium]